MIPKNKTLSINEFKEFIQEMKKNGIDCFHHPSCVDRIYFKTDQRETLMKFIKPRALNCIVESSAHRGYSFIDYDEFVVIDIETVI